MTIKEWLSLVAIALTLYSFIPYIRSINTGKTRPHLFSWVIWGLTTFVVFLAQLADNGGVGAFPIGISGLITFYIAYLAYRHKADLTITVSDWIYLIMAISSLPLWFVTQDPLSAVIILTTVDTLGFGPTLRKAWHHPEQEHSLFYLLFAIRNGLVVMALENYSMTTLLFPVVTAIACLLLILMIYYRKPRS